MDENNTTSTTTMTQQKKEMLEKILTALVPYRDMAEWFLLIVQEKWNDKLKEELYQEILKQIKNINSKTQQEKIKNALKELKEKSESVTKMEENDAEKMLDDFIQNL